MRGNIPNDCSDTGSIGLFDKGEGISWVLGLTHLKVDASLARCNMHEMYSVLNQV